MKQRLFNQETLALIAAFEQHTRAQVLDCYDAEVKVIFVVPEGQGRKAIGAKGEVISKLREKLNRHIQVIEFSSDPKVFIANIFFNYKPKSVEIEDRGFQKHATVFVEPENKARAIGKLGKNLSIARNVLFRHFEIESLSVSS